MIKHFFATKNDYGILFLRVASGIAMLPYGLSKLGIIGGGTFQDSMGFLTGMGIPFFVAILVIVGESLGAISLIIGFCTRFCAASLTVIMAGAVMAMMSKGYMAGYATPLLFLIMYVTLTLNGAGAWSIDQIIAKRKVS
ncbi:MAG: DoxX family protein [Candidatus Peribacteraceae bacterium]|nr:DoxX family protein [Candidatus Peribacteraceae bacterium]